MSAKDAAAPVTAVEQEAVAAPVEDKAQSVAVETVETLEPTTETSVESVATQTAAPETSAQAEREVKPRRSRKPRQPRPETDEPIEAPFEAIRAGAIWSIRRTFVKIFLNCLVSSFASCIVIL